MAITKKPAIKTSRAAKSAPATKKQSTTSLTIEQQTFVEELISDRKMIAWKAYQRAYRNSNRRTCEVNSSKLLRLTKIQNAIQAAKDARLKRVRFSQDEMFNHLISMATADTTEIMEYRRHNCRHCHGVSFAFQWKDKAEFEKACADAERSAEEGQIPVMPDNAGGYGFDAQKQPHPDCPNCGGEGYGGTHFHDTRFLTGGAKLLFAGVEETQHGIKIKVHDQMAALKIAAQHMGMLDPKLTLKGDKENPLMALLAGLPGNTIRPVDDNGDDQ